MINRLFSQFRIHDRSTETFLMKVTVLFVTAVLQLSTSQQTYYRSQSNSTEAVLMLGGLFPVHANNGGTCGKIQDYGLQRLEAMVLAVNMINNDQELLPDLQLGFDIRDTCSQPDTALQASLDFIVGLDYDLQESNNNKTVVGPGISGVVGSASSSESISAASLLRLFQTPQISYASTARILSDKTRFEYFFRTLPPDMFQAKVMVELLVYYNWTYVIAINSDDVYGQDGIEAFVNDLNSISIIQNDTCQSYCIVGNLISIPLTANEEYYDRVISQINQPWIMNSSIIVLFGQPATAEGILNAIERYDQHRPMSLVVSDGAGDNLPLEYYSLAHGMISIIPEYRESQEFNDYFTSLKPSTNSNPWFAEYWESVFSCSFNMSQNIIDHCNESAQSLSDDINYYQQNSKVPFVLDAVYAFAHAIHNMLNSVCGNITVCDEVRVERYGKFIINGKLLLQYLHNVSFDGISTNRIDFDENGDQGGGYWINNLQKLSENFEFVTLADWKMDTYQESSLKLESVQWGPNNRTEPVSICSYPCLEGHFPLVIEGESSCCWTCELCRGDREVGNGLECFECQLGFSPNNNRSSCQENSLTYLKWFDVVALIILLFTILGFVCTVIIAIVFIICYRSDIVKASSRELTAIILTGLFLCFLTPIFSIGKPTAVTCGISRFLFGFAFSFCSAALLVRTNRIHRIFNRDANSSQRPPLISSKVQIIFTFMLVGVQVVINAVWLIIEIPGIKYDYHDNITELTCSYTPFVWVVVSLGYNLTLLIITAYFAFRTRKIPQNFNETKFINLTLYSVIIIWLAFIPAYIAISTVDTRNTSQSASQLFAVVLSAFTTLCSLFFPKLYFIVSAKRKGCEQ